MQATTSSGKVLITNLAFDPVSRRPMARIYLIQGPAGWGPYRSGFEGHLAHFHPTGSSPALHAVWYQDHFSAHGTPKDSPAARAGLDVTSPFFVIDSVDGQTFGWDPDALTFHITHSPTIKVEAVKLPVFFGPSHTTRTITNARITAPPDPADATLVPLDPQLKILKALLADQKTWQDLVVLRSSQPDHAPLAIQIEGQTHWAVFGQSLPTEDKPPRVFRRLELWKEDPRLGHFDSGLEEVLPTPSDTIRSGQLIPFGDRWYQLDRLAQDANTGALTAMDLHPWKPEVLNLLTGAYAASGSTGLPTRARESLEQTANEALVEWKTLVFPGEVTAFDAARAGQLVVRLEKGLLSLDLEVKAIRARLDTAARAEADRKAQAELAAKEGKSAPPAAVPASESERLADLLDQRKAILMAVLGSAKQALANLRR